ncbi:serine/threonine protein kinase [Capronia epimyces CBS 606.96]|uniref:Serine/threonine protein kinase n=1 Tax=Capronia epimyces CBS 606.96 TaxID=1182542 RepID=W9Z407_9EURO|nr:serine/threonine protein kinase [Capronia epimyces CBS 606.96]EXJ89249.1 serine/threonine protein kinase [Capronia epimyces CBS 606.96]
MHLSVPVHNVQIDERAKWTRDRAKVQRRLSRWRRKSWFDSGAELFALSRARYDDQDEQWECTHLLGRGSFGMVGQWTKFDRHGRAVDTMAIKQTDIDDREVDRQKHLAIPWEVLIMRGLADQGCRNVGGLRKYKLFIADPPKWRYYLEYHRHGTLAGLVERYRDHNHEHPRHKDYIPEAFIWQALYGFAQTAYHMSTVRFDKSVAPPGKDHFVLHLDLKHENVLMCEASTDEDLINYPTLKVGDWGMAEYTSRDDVHNSHRWKYQGTIVWCPPEQLRQGQYGRHWKHPVLGGPDHPFTMAHVIWQIGANIYGLMELELDNLDLYERVKRYETSESSLRHNGYSVLSHWNNSRYSSKLMDLVEDCVRLDPARRPSPRELVARAQQGLKPHVDKARRTGSAPKVRLD